MVEAFFFARFLELMANCLRLNICCFGWLASATLAAAFELPPPSVVVVVVAVVAEVEDEFVFAASRDLTALSGLRVLLCIRFVCSKLEPTTFRFVVVVFNLSVSARTLSSGGDEFVVVVVAAAA